MRGRLTQCVMARRRPRLKNAFLTSGERHDGPYARMCKYGDWEVGCQYLAAAFRTKSA